MAGGRGSAGSDYRNLFGRPDDPREIYSGLRPAGLTAAGENRQPTRAMLQKLANRMVGPFDWTLSVKPPRNPGIGEGSIPAGYTYLAQLVAHDMVRSVASLDAVGGEEGIPRNFRLSALVLDTVYGGGPLVAPLAYAMDTERDSDQRRVRLRLGRSDKSAERDAYRDLARINAPLFWTPLKQRPDGAMVQDPPMQVPPDPPVLNDKAPDQFFRDVLIADPRNDDNLFVSQLLVLFHLLHNTVLGQLERLEGGIPERLRPRSELHRFGVARQIVTRLYRRVVRLDLMGRILSARVHRRYEGAFLTGSGFLDRGADWRIPVEFSHAAFRFGHAMIRPHYRINDRLSDFSQMDGANKTGTVSLYNALEATSAGRTVRVLPFGADWWVNWSHFFEFPGQEAPQHAMRIAPRFDDDLQRAELVAHFGRKEEGGVPYRDLLRSAEIGVRTVDSLYRRIPRTYFASNAPLLDPAERSRRIRDWLLQPDGGGDFTADEIASISENPPLSFYVLFEAAVETGGEALGVLGSVVVAEAVYGALSGVKGIFEDNPDLDTWCKAVFPGGEPGTADQLVTYVAGRGDLKTLI